MMSSAFFFVLILILASEVACFKVKFTAYHLAQERDHPSKKEVDLQECDGKVIGKVNKKFAQACRWEGSCKLNNGKIANLRCCEGEQNSNYFKCFYLVKCPQGDKSNCLKAWSSIAVKKNNSKFPSQRTFFIKELNGLKLPSGEVHDGCVRVDDSCGTCTNEDHIDLYAYSIKSQDWVASKFKTVDAVQRSCTPKTYKEQ